MISCLLTTWLALSPLARPALRPTRALRHPRSSWQPRAAAVADAADASSASEQLLALAATPDKTDEQRAQILALCQQLEVAGTGVPQLSSPELLGNYEMLYYDSSVDGGRDGKPPSWLRAALGAIFSQRGSFQHIPEAGERSDGKALGKLVNYVDVGVLGGLLRARLVATGDFAQLEADEVATLAARNGTALTDQTVRVTFAPPRVAIAGLCFELSGAAAQPPVELCTTYLDENVRLGLVTSGGRFVFGRGGKAEEEWADDWQAVVARQPTPEWVPLVLATSFAACVALRPLLVAQAAYAALGLAIGFFATKFMKFAASGALRERMASLLEVAKPRERARALVLRIDPSLAEREGEELRLGDLRGPLPRMPGLGKGLGGFDQWRGKKGGAQGGAQGA